jgi:MFS transporter, FSR family, fosmidomycin resistance protein
MAQSRPYIVSGFAGVAHAFAHLSVLLYATVVLVLEREWGMSYDELLALGIPMMVMFGLGALPAGWLGDRWSETGMLAVYLFGLGAALMLCGAAQGPLTLGAALTLVGLFAAIYHPVAIPWLVHHAPNRGRAFGINGVYGSAGTAAAALVAAGLASLISWRAAFIVPGAACLLTGVIFIVAWRRDAFGARLPEPPAKPNADASGERKRVFIVLAMTVMCTGMIYQITSFALPKLFDQRLTGIFGDSVLGIGGAVTAVYLASALAQVIGGEMADRYRLRSIYIAAQFLQIPFLAAAFVLIHPALIPAAALMIAMNVAGQPAENALLARHTPPEWRGRVYGAKFVITLGVSSLGVAMVPLVYRLTGSLDALFPAMIVFALAAALIATRLPAEPGRERAQAETVPAE